MWQKEEKWNVGWNHVCLNSLLALSPFTAMNVYIFVQVKIKFILSFNLSLEGNMMVNYNNCIFVHWFLLVSRIYEERSFNAAVFLRQKISFRKKLVEFVNKRNLPGFKKAGEIQSDIDTSHPTAQRRSSSRDELHIRRKYIRFIKISFLYRGNRFILDASYAIILVCDMRDFTRYVKTFFVKT